MSAVPSPKRVKSARSNRVMYTRGCARATRRADLYRSTGYSHSAGVCVCVCLWIILHVRQRRDWTSSCTR